MPRKVVASCPDNSRGSYWEIPGAFRELPDGRLGKFPGLFLEASLKVPGELAGKRWELHGLCVAYTMGAWGGQPALRDRRGESPALAGAQRS